MLLANKTQSSHRITAGGKRRVAIPGVVVAGHPVQKGMDANLGSLDRVYESWPLPVERERERFLAIPNNSNTHT